MYDLADFKKILLKKHPVLTEKWLQDRLADDPSLLGLGELSLVRLEKKVPGGGRLDMVLSDDDSNRRFEVELMLGSVDASHVVRTIEYWDIERRRFPGHDHVAVLVAEDVTTRFLNVLNLMAGSIPLIVLQLNALDVGGKLVLDFVRVLDQTDLRLDDDPDPGTGEVDRSFWENKVPADLLNVCDQSLGMLNEASSETFELNYLRSHIGLRRKGVVFNLLAFWPKKTKGYTHMLIRNIDGAVGQEKFGELGIPAISVKPDRVRITLTPSEAKKHSPLLAELIREAASSDPTDD